MGQGGRGGCYCRGARRLRLQLAREPELLRGGAKFEKRVGADEGKAQQFLSTLESQPAAARADYMRAHPDEVSNMAKIPDPALQAKFRGLVTNRG